MISSEDEFGFQNDNDYEEQIQPQRTQSIFGESEDNHQHFASCNKSTFKNDKIYSLSPDIATGWLPKIKLNNPLPLSFWNDNHDELLHLYEAPNKTNNLILCFLGPRQQSTYYAWYGKPFPFPYSHIPTPQKIKFTDRIKHGNIPQYSLHLLEFDSHFQSGNLDMAFKVDEDQYELFMRVDSNSRGHLQWFNFKVKKMKTGKTYRFTICNFEKEKYYIMIK